MNYTLYVQRDDFNLDICKYIYLSLYIFIFIYIYLYISVSRERQRMYEHSEAALFYLMSNTNARFESVGLVFFHNDV